MDLDRNRRGAVELAARVGKGGLVVGLDFSSGMLEKAKRKSVNLNLSQLCFVQANAARFPSRTPHSEVLRAHMPSMS